MYKSLFINYSHLNLHFCINRIIFHIFTNEQVFCIDLMDDIGS
jgi:hypothetical protein